MLPNFTDKSDALANQLNFANLSLASNTTGGRVNVEDARKYRRSGAVGAGAGSGTRNVSGHYNDEGEYLNAGQQPGRGNASPLVGSGFAQAQQQWPRSPVLDQFGLGGLGIGADPNALAGLGMNLANLNPLLNPGAAQMLALAQAQQLSTAASFAQAGFGGAGSAGGGGLGLPRGAGGMGGMGGMGGGRQGPASSGRRSPMLGKSHSPTPDRGGGGAGGAAGGGGGAGGGAGVAGPDDVDMRVLEDTTGWLRVLRLHVSASGE
jgi:hypothetical protein